MYIDGMLGIYGFFPEQTNTLTTEQTNTLTNYIT